MPEKKENVDELIIMSADWNGFKREKAVHQLGLLADPTAIPALIIRVNDWVPQVQVAAHDALNQLMTNENAGAFLANLATFEHLKSCGRENHLALIERVQDFLLIDCNINLVIGAIETSNFKVARLCCDLIHRNELLATDVFIHKCFQSSDILVRLYGAKLLRTLANNKRSLILTSLKDCFMPIRREGFQLSIANQYITIEKYKSFMFDNHCCVREIAVKHAEKFSIDALKLYQQTLSDVSSTVSKKRHSIWGLVHLRAKGVTSEISTFLTSEFVSLRKQSLVALVTLNGEESFGKLKSKLTDNAFSVQKLAASLVIKNNVYFDAKMLLSLYNNSSQINTLKICLLIYKNTNKWEYLLFLINLSGIVTTEHKRELSLLNNALYIWHGNSNRVGTQPTKSQIENIKVFFEKPANNLDPDILKYITFGLKMYGV